MDETNLPPIGAAPPLTPTPPVEPERNEILYGRNGLRAGWRALLFMILVVCIVVLLNLVGHYVTQKLGQTRGGPAQLTTLTPGFIAAGELITFAVILGPSLIMGRIERRNLAHLLPQIFLGRIAVGISRN
jgi:hypothetical protein